MSTVLKTSALEQRPIELAVVSSHNPEPDAASENTIVVPVVDDVPDGGYGWVVVSACSLITSFFVGLTYSWGVMQAGLSKQKLAPDSTLAFIGSTTISFVAFGAVVNTHVIRFMGTRNAALLGCFLLGFGQILSGWSARSVGGLFVTNGIIMGFGCSICFLACGTLPAQWFKRRRGMANGLIFAGGGVGGCVWSVLMQSLLDKVGIEWTFRILGFITLVVTMPAAMLLKERTRRTTASIDWSLFKDPKFLLLFFGSGIATFPLLVPPFFIPLYASSLGLSSSLGSLLLALFNLSSAFGRVGFGALCDVLGPLSSLAIALVVSALSLLAIWPVSTALAPFIVFIVINGLGNGGFFSTMPSVVGHVYGPRISIAFAMVVSSWAVGYIMGAPVAGYILERYGGSEAGRAAFRPAMYYAGSMSLGSASFVLGVRHLTSKQFFAFA
ncbi:MFS general substrate transporter [Leucogyrophana mollusca]|uniref:MFS general substrate transporter n=1 Tax=Leucogyrophana mollusca TaxID=85980 RepID=A0ACB8BBT8_9AGAM|nr:MFS general substrate transporter [Leucogyrophana mollusca]